MTEGDTADGTNDEDGIIIGADGLARCSWGNSAPEYIAYHDDEWGQPLRDNDALFEHMSLEAFQAGLSWLTILRKRENFRKAFAKFRINTVARFTDADVQRLLTDPSIVRNRAKIMAVIANAQAAKRLDGSLSELLWSFAPQPRRPRPQYLREIPASIPESQAMAKELKRRGFRFIGPTTAYALMQATGMVDDHLANCFVLTR